MQSNSLKFFSHTQNINCIWYPTFVGPLYSRYARCNLESPHTWYPATYPGYLYHYTDNFGKDGILKSGVIRAKIGPVAVYGEGVYLTSIFPEEGKRKILVNNYGLNVFGSHKDDRADYYFEFNRKCLQDVKYVGSYQGRDVWVCHRDIHLDWDGYISHGAVIRL